MTKEDKKIYDKQRYVNNRLKMLEYQKQYNVENKQKVLEYGREHYKINKDDIRNKRKDYYISHKEDFKRRGKLHKTKNPHYGVEYDKQRRAVDEQFKLSFNLRRRIRHAFVNILHINKDCHTFDILGTSPKDLKRYIEDKFVLGMSWSNYGKNGWDVDHIIPLSSAKNREELIKLCHYTNLQPLWHIDNIKKGNKLVYSNI